MFLYTKTRKKKITFIMSTKLLQITNLNLHSRPKRVRYVIAFPKSTINFHYSILSSHSILIFWQSYTCTQTQMSLAGYRKLLVYYKPSSGFDKFASVEIHVKRAHTHSPTHIHSKKQTQPIIGICCCDVLYRFFFSTFASFHPLSRRGFGKLLFFLFLSFLLLEWLLSRTMSGCILFE